MNKAVLFLLATTIGLGIISLHLVRTLRAEREQISSLQAQIDRLQRAQSQAAQTQGARWSIETPFEPVPAAQPTPSPAEAPLRAAAPAAATPLPATATVAAAQPEAPSREEQMRLMRESMERRRALLQNPEYRDAMRAQRKLMYARRYPDLAQELDMTPEQFDQMTTLLANQELQRMEDMGRLWVDGVDGPPDQAAIQERVRKEQVRQQKNEAALASLLGATKLQAWKDYQETLGVRHEVTGLRSLLASKGLPLQEELVRPLVKALADEQQRLAKEANPNGLIATATLSAAPAMYVGSNFVPQTGRSQAELQERQLEQMTKYYERITDAASNVLSPEQLEIFRQQQDARLKMQQVQLRMMRMQAESQGQGGAPANAAFTQGIATPR